MELFEGQTITAPFLSEPAIVKKFEIRSGYYKLEVVLKNSNLYKRLHLNEMQFNQIELEIQEIELTDENDEFFFWIEANRIRLAYQFDPLLAVSVSQIDPLPHQIEAVYSYILKDPKIRFMIADDAGAGKTIMAGLTVKELQYRHLVSRVLIVTPGHLKFQWQRELKEKFNFQFRIIDRSSFDSNWGLNIWEDSKFAITSIDFLKQDDILVTFRSSIWDLVIVDEAHKLSAYSYNLKSRKKVNKTKRYLVGEELSRNTSHMLFLTATPHKGDDENFRLLLDLLRPNFFATKEYLMDSIIHKDNPIFIRRLKEDMIKFDKTKIFPPRHVTTVTFNLTDAEQELYDSVTDYVRHNFDRAKERRSITFAMLILQRRLTSSIYAILKSLENRKKHLEKFLEDPGQASDKDSFWEKVEEDELEDLDEDERWNLENKLEKLTISKTRKEIKIEIEKIDELILVAQQVKKAEIESKLVKLRDDILSNLGDRKLLIFTEFRDTLNYLHEKMVSWGYEVCVIHGNMNMDKRIESEKLFLNDKQIMIATEAAGEGVNLQFCSWMINYDIPWNPNRLEQRLGRIHRYGQDKEVYIYNMVSRDTREGQILEKLFEKLNSMKRVLGSDKVFDIIGEIIPGINLSDILQEAVIGQRRIDEIYEVVENIDQDQVNSILEKVLAISLATHHIDYSGIVKSMQQSNESKLIPEYIEDYFRRAFQKKTNGVVTKSGEYYRIERVPSVLRNLNDNFNFKTSFGTIDYKYTKITFDKQLARKKSDYEFIAPGHPLLEGLNELILESKATFDKIPTFIDDNDKYEGILWYIIGEITDGLNNLAGKRMFCLFQKTQGDIQRLDPSIIWDFSYSSGTEIDTVIKDQLINEDTIEEYAINEVLFPYYDEIKAKREHACKIKEKYGLKSLNYLIHESNDKILNYQLQIDKGKDMKLALFNEERRNEDLKSKFDMLEREIELEKNLTISSSNIIGKAIIIPASKLKTVSDSQLNGKMYNDPDVEMIGMQIAIRHEESQGWEVDDIHDEDLGFDLRSSKFNDEGIKEYKYIEVKGRAYTGAIRLSSNEWKKAKRFRQDYWLYIVTNTRSNNPKLEIIRDPYGNFTINEDIYATGYIIPEKNWKKGVEND